MGYNFMKSVRCIPFLKLRSIKLNTLHIKYVIYYGLQKAIAFLILNDKNESSSFRMQVLIYQYKNEQ